LTLIGIKVVRCGVFVLVFVVEIVVIIVVVIEDFFIGGL
jgi:hypothetical protein